ncbi:MAG: hypothetical protein LWX01_01145 [Deltaproteobacteria bacterium]|nr:hypothetical protein [Deltaproteobacteria bacterium]
MKDNYRLISAGLSDPHVTGVSFYPIPNKGLTLPQKIGMGIQLKMNQFEAVYWASDMVRKAYRQLKDQSFDLIIANDLNTLPLSLSLASKCGHKVLLDAHEYEPRHFDDNWLFNFFFKDYWDYICRKYLPQVDAMTTVCQGIADEYKRVYGVECGVLTNAPFYEKLEPKPVHQDDRIHIIHHGGLHTSRRLENMILLMDHLDERFTLDLMLVPNKPRYFRKLKKLAQRSKRIHFRDPVPMQHIAKEINDYDIGLFLLWPGAFNYRMALPNKLFEFIQGRLCIAIWPSPEMARLVREHNIGVVAEDFSIESMASALNQLTTERINHFKEQSHKSASVLCAKKNQEVLQNLVSKLLEN